MPYSKKMWLIFILLTYHSIKIMLPRHYCTTLFTSWASGSYKHEYCRGSPVFNTPPPNGVGWWGVGYRTATTVLMLVTPRGPWFTYSSTYNLHRATPVLAKLPYCSMPNNWVYQYIRRIRLYLSEGKIMILIMIVMIVSQLCFFSANRVLGSKELDSSLLTGTGVTLCWLIVEWLHHRFGASSISSSKELQLDNPRSGPACYYLSSNHLLLIWGTSIATNLFHCFTWCTFNYSSGSWINLPIINISMMICRRRELGYRNILIILAACEKVAESDFC